jgi:hypothetical protein
LKCYNDNEFNGVFIFYIMSDEPLEIPEDLTTEEQLRRYREMLAANLCAQGVRALPSEPLTQLIAKVSKIDRQQRNVDALQTYAAQLKSFAIANQCDYAIQTSARYIDANSNTTAAAANLTGAYIYFSVPTSFTVNGTAYSVSAANVILLSSLSFRCVWGSSASTAYQHDYSVAPYIISNFSDIRTFAALKTAYNSNSSGYYSFVNWGTTGLNYGKSGYFLTRYDDTQYRVYVVPYNTTYDYWRGASYCMLYNPIWAFKLPTLGTAPNNLFPTQPVISSPEFYY